MSSNKTLKRRQGTLNQGVTYEIKINALFALRYLDPKYEVESFAISQNVDDFGNFDDVIIRLQKTNGETFKFCLQLKHFQLDGAERKRALKYAHFYQTSKSKWNNKVPFNLLDYWRSMQTGTNAKHRKLDETIKYVIFTNKNKDEKEPRFLPVQDDYVNLINVDGDVFFLNEFKIPEKSSENSKEIDASFLNKLIILCKQPHEEDLNNIMKILLKNIFPLDSAKLDAVLSKYLEHITNWFSGYCGERSITDEEIKFKLGEFVLSFYMCQPEPSCEMGFSENAIRNWMDILSKYKAVLVENSRSAKLFERCTTFVLQAVHSVLQNYTSVSDWNAELSEEDLECFHEKFDDADTDHEMYELWGNEKVNTVTLQKVYFYLWKSGLVPLVLAIDTEETTMKILMGLIDLVPGKLIVLYQNMLSEDFFTKDTDPKILRGFSDLEQKDQEYVLHQMVTFQGRPCQVKDVLSAEEARSYLQTTDVIEILLQEFSVGRLEFELPKLFIERRLDNIIVKPDIFTDRTVYIICFESEEMFARYQAHPSQDQLKTEKWLEQMYVLTKYKEAPLASGAHPARKGARCILPLNYKILINIEYSRLELEQAIEERKTMGVDFHVCNMEEFNGQFHTSSFKDSGFTQTVNVVVVPDKQTFANYLESNSEKFRLWEIYNFSEIDFDWVPLTCKYVVANDNEAQTLRRQHSLKGKVSFDFYKLHTGVQDCVLEFLGAFGCSLKVAAFIDKSVTFSEKGCEFDFCNCFYYNNLNIISGSPGMGKSVLVHYLMSICPIDFWAIFVNFNVHSKYLLENSFNLRKTTNILKYFMQYQKLSEMERSLVDTHLEQGNVCLFFDGYDEIQPEAEEKLGEFLKNLVEKGYQLFVTTRNVKVDVLERKLNCISRTITPFDEKDQFDYLSECYKAKFGQNEEKVDEFVRKLLQITKSNMSAWDVQFSGIPLQTLMISEIYMDACEQYCQKCHPADLNADINVDCLHLYEQFIELKVSNLQSKEQMNHPSALKYFKKAVKQSLDNHKLCAIRSIFYTNREEMKAPDDFIDEIKSGEDKIGLIDRFLEDGTPVFVHRTFAEYLIGLYISENFRQDFARRLFSVIIRSPVYSIVRQIVDRLLSKDSPLHLAVLNCDLIQFQALLMDQNLDTLSQIRDKGGRTLLHLAMSWGQRHEFLAEDAVRRLGSIYNWNEFRDALQNAHKSCRNGRGTEDFVKIILRIASNEKGLLEAVDDIFEYTPLDYGFEVRAMENVNAFVQEFAVIKGDGCFNVVMLYMMDDFVMEYFIKLWNNDYWKKQYQLIGDCRGFLFVCATYDYDFLARVVLQLKRANGSANTDFSDYGFSLLHYAAYWGSDRMVKLLIDEEDISVDLMEGRRKQTPLHWAAGRGNVSTVRTLLSRGANPTAVDIIERTPLYIASENRHRETEEVLAEAEMQQGGRKTRITDLFVAAKAGDYDAVKLLLDGGADANEATGGGSMNTPLVGASYEGHLEVVRLLLDRGADINQCDNDKWSALMHASWKGHLDVVKLLLARGANVHIKGVEHFTAMVLAVYESNHEIVELLQAAGAKEDQDLYWLPERRKAP